MSGGDSDETVHHESTVSTARDATIVGVLLAFAIVGAVFLGMNLAIGERQLPRELRGTTPYFLGVTLLLAGLTWYKSAKSKLRFRVVERGGKVALEVADRVRVQMPFVYTFAWHPVPTGKLDMTALELAVMNDAGECVLLLTQVRGAIYAVPNWGLPRHIPHDPDVAFSCNAVLELQPLIDELALPYGPVARK